MDTSEIQVAVDLGIPRPLDCHDWSRRFAWTWSFNRAAEAREKTRNL